MLDKLREKRNLADYTGALLDETATDASIDQATRLLGELREWLGKHRPELLQALPTGQPRSCSGAGGRQSARRRISVNWITFPVWQIGRNGV